MIQARLFIIHGHRIKHARRERFWLRAGRLLRFFGMALMLLVACRFSSDDNSTPLPAIVTQPPPPSAFDSLTALTTTAAPDRDMADLAYRFRAVDAPRVARLQPPANEVGDVVQFWVKNRETGENERVEAALLYQSAELNMWVQVGVKVNAQQMAAAAARIERHILPTNHAFFGQEWQPGVDGDDRMNILHLSDIGAAAAAYFWSGDEYVTAVNPFSNQREMLYVSQKEAPIGSERYFTAVAHELQHLIQWYTDGNEESWLNEGLSELAVHVNGYEVERAGSYARQTDIQLTDLSQEEAVVAAHYAAAYLFSVYFLDRYGEAATRLLVRHPQNGRRGFEEVLHQLDPGLSFDDLFADWLAANALTSLGRGEGVFSYQDVDMPAITAEKIRRLPAVGQESVSQYGADYFRVTADSPVTFVFTGTQQINLIDAQPHSGRYAWFTLPADESDMRLTRRFDLTDVSSATFSFWAWYNIEEGWDYGYLAASTDDGRTWTLLETDSTTRDNPQGNSFGPGYTGRSGGGDQPIWVREDADLTPFVGGPVLVRFHYITDGAVQGPGFVIDDVTVPELDYADGFEGGEGGWEAAGFVRSTNVLPQRFILQQILIGEDDIQVNRLSVEENQRGLWRIPLGSRYNEAVIIVAGNTPVTRRAAAYAYEFSR